jgi:hypothetical protein
MVKIKNESGESIEAIVPVIISASRATDIPAFFAESFIDSLRKGYTRWRNPFNNRTSYISFDKTRLIVFWTKNPEPLIPYLDEIDRMGINYYFQYTLNDYEKEGFEPNLPQLSKRIETFVRLSEMIGKGKVIWRFDPLILTEKITIPVLLKRIKRIGDALINHTNKLVFSFIDVNKYRKVQKNLIKHSDYFTKDNILESEFTNAQMLEFAEGLNKIYSEWKRENSEFNIASCAEEIDLENYGIEHNSCVYDKQIAEQFGKDKGQRKYCGCIMSKDIGAYNTCKCGCVYCYAR